jgi:hypothetical protein
MPVFSFWIYNSISYIKGRICHRLRAFENRLVRGIFEPEMNERTEGWRKMHNEKLHNLYSSPNIIRMIKSGNITWARHVAGMGHTKIGRSQRPDPFYRTASPKLMNAIYVMGVTVV